MSYHLLLLIQMGNATMPRNTVCCSAVDRYSKYSKYSAFTMYVHFVKNTFEQVIYFYEIF